MTTRSRMIPLDMLNSASNPFSLKQYIDTRQIGDGKLPNKYWVSISNDYYYSSEPGKLDWASERGDFKPEGNTVGIFDHYLDAKEYAKSIEIDFDLPIRSVFIEDRLSGQIFENIVEEHEVHRIEYDALTREDVHFTEKRLGHKIT